MNIIIYSLESGFQGSTRKKKVVVETVSTKEVCSMMWLPMTAGTALGDRRGVSRRGSVQKPPSQPGAKIAGLPERNFDRVDRARSTKNRRYKSLPIPREARLSKKRSGLVNSRRPASLLRSRMWKSEMQSARHKNLLATEWRNNDS